MGQNKPTQIDRNRKAIAGIQQHYAGATSIVLDGMTFKPADIVKILQDQIDHADATSAAKVTFHQHVAAQNAADAKANATFLALKTRVLSDFKTSAEVLGGFGLALPQRRKPTPETLAKAAAKREATRKARNTLGPKKRLGIKGEVPAVPAPAATPAASKA